MASWNSPDVAEAAQRRLDALDASNETTKRENAADFTMGTKLGGGIIGAIAGTIAGGNTLTGFNLGSKAGEGLGSMVVGASGHAPKGYQAMDLTSINGLMDMFKKKKLSAQELKDLGAENASDAKDISQFASETGMDSASMADAGEAAMTAL